MVDKDIPIFHNEILKAIGHFSAVSVPSKFGRKGIGKMLVKAAEEYLLEWAGKEHQADANLRVVMEMGVVDLRTDLFPWYQAQGYIIINEISPIDPGFAILLAPDVNAKLILMQKCLT